jgi:hypothetical protein
MNRQLAEGQKVRIVGTRFDGCVGRIESVLVGRPGDDLSVEVRVSKVGPGVVLSRGETCVIPAEYVEPDER